jgi:cell division protease FtsH
MVPIFTRLGGFPLMSNPRLASTARKRSRFQEAVQRVGEALAPIGRCLTRDRLSAFLLFASIALIVTFFSLLGSLGSKGAGKKVPLSSVIQLGNGQLLRSAALLDYDHQVVVETAGGLQLYADYPASDAATQELLNALTKGGTRVEVDPG